MQGLENIQLVRIYSVSFFMVQIWGKEFPWELIPLGNSLKIQCDKSNLYLIRPNVLHYAALPIGKKVGRKVNVGLERKVFFLKI